MLGFDYRAARRHSASADGSGGDDVYFAAGGYGHDESVCDGVAEGGRGLGFQAF